MPNTKTETANVHFEGDVTVLASNFRILDDTDPSKVGQFVLSGLSTNSVSEITIPDSDDTAVFLTATQTLTNKTLTAPVINNAATISVDDDNLTITDNADQTKVAAFQASGITTGTTRTFTFPDVDGTLQITARTGQVYQVTSHAKVGATAGWAVNAADDLGLLATCPASQTASTLVIPITGLKVGWTITDFALDGQIESAGNTVTLDADLRKLTAADSDVTDASVQTMTQISVTADDTIEDSNSLTSLITPEVIAAGETLYLLLTATTGAATDIALQGARITVTEA